MFGTNEIVGKKFFKEQPAERQDKVCVTSVFATLQGEGPFSGRPAIFIRMAKCNLACSFCDTYFDKGDWLFPDEVAAMVRKEYGKLYDDEPRKAGIVITGGEPTLQPKLANLVGLLASEMHYSFIQMETNGILASSWMHPSLTIVCSPKCAEKEGKPTVYLEPHSDVMQNAHAFKFVIKADPSSPYYYVPRWALEWRKRTGRAVYVSPMNEYNRLPAMVSAMQEPSMFAPSMEERNRSEIVSFWDPGLLDMRKNQENHEYAARYALHNGLFLSLQMHLYASIA